MPIKTLLLLGLGALSFALQWFLGNLLYASFVRYLDIQYHIKEAHVIASVSSYVVPAILALAVIVFTYRLGRHHISPPGSNTDAQKAHDVTVTFEFINPQQIGDGKM